MTMLRFAPQAMLVSAAVAILIVSISHFREYLRTGRTRLLVACLSTVPVAVLLLAIAWGGL